VNACSSMLSATFVQCQIELPKLVSELDSNQVTTGTLLAELNYFLVVQHQLIDNYLTSYTAGNTSLEDVANGIQYDIITSTVDTKKARLVCFPSVKQS